MQDLVYFPAGSPFIERVATLRGSGWTVKSLVLGSGGGEVMVLYTQPGSAGTAGAAGDLYSTLNGAPHGSFEFSGGGSGVRNALAVPSA